MDQSRERGELTMEFWSWLVSRGLFGGLGTLSLILLLRLLRVEIDPSNQKQPFSLHEHQGCILGESQASNKEQSRLA